MNTSPLLVRARALTGFADLVRELGGNAEGLLREVGLTADMIIQPEATISMSSAVTLLENAATRLAAPDFGLRLAERQDYSALGPIALIARRTDTVGNALSAIARNLPYHVARTSLRMEAGPTAELLWLRYELPMEICGAHRQSVEMCCLLLIQTLRMLRGDIGADWQVVFAHPAGVPISRYREIFGCNVACQQSGNGVIVPKALLEQVLDGGSPHIRVAVERFVSNLIRRNPLDLVQQIEELIARQLANGDCSLAGIAQQLGMNERTLQRRLEARQIRFSNILDRVRQSQAREFLAQPALPLSEVAILLGYSEQRSLSRACLRWFGTTPAALRLNS
ncbi:MAG: AraC family transcriptional regulator [Betaproteobacteria bacterium]|nr:AraC family transcriptional regulator [Betaproteobacteria bacterium]